MDSPNVMEVAQPAYVAPVVVKKSLGPAGKLGVGLLFVVGVVGLCVAAYYMWEKRKTAVAAAGAAAAQPQEPWLRYQVPPTRRPLRPSHPVLPGSTQVASMIRVSCERCPRR